MLIDKIRITVQAGKGGEGKISFGSNKKPNGGDGGKGGDIILEGSENIYDLGKLKNITKYKAENGEIGGVERSTGKDGKDIIIKVPITTVVENGEGEIIHRITKTGEREIIAKGGRGGLGNFNFRYGQRLTLNKTTPGEVGEKDTINLELRLIADIVFIGFPNAGKSSMLNMLTNADVKTAPYPFTTLEPYKGVCDGMILLDLPGLIEGSSEGKGVGTRFAKHTDYAKTIAHFLSLESADLLSDYSKIRKELKHIDKKLSELKEFIILTKADMYNKEYISKQKKVIKTLNLPYIVTSCYDFSKLGEIKKFFKEQLKN